MKPWPWLILSAILLAGLGGAAGGWIGVQYGLRQVQANRGLDEVMHHQLDLTPEQNRRIETLEADFRKRRLVLEGEMQAANRDLARALAANHSYGPEAQQAIHRSHAAMGALQEATIQHILAMRAVLTPAQAAVFDRTISATLDSDSK